jgi:hypothetical protein
LEKMQVRVARPASVVRACVPLPEGFAGGFDHQIAFELVDAIGVRHPAQATPVAWRAPLEAGHDEPREIAVVEIAAVVGNRPAMPEVFELVPLAEGPLNGGAHNPGPWAAQIVRHLEVQVDGRKLAMVGGGTFRDGQVLKTRMFHGRNFNLWLTTYSGLDLVQFDLVMHAGAPGGTALLFDLIDLRSEGSRLDAVFAWPEPQAVQPSAEDRVNLVAPRPLEKHALRLRGMRWFSGVLFERSSLAGSQLAHELARGHGWGVSLNWTSDWACYQPHALPLPQLDYRRSSAEASQIGAWSNIANQLQDGGPIGLGANAGQGVRIDWLHPWGGRYGGITGGGFRHQWAGVDVAATGEPSGMLELQARLAAIMARDAVAIVNPKSGQPALLEEYLSPHWGNWAMSRSNALFDKDTALFVNPPPAGAPADLADMESYQPIDWQHRDRATQPAVALVWLANSPVAHWYLRMSAELWRWAQHSGAWLANRKTAALQRPMQGADVGRADGHGFTCMAAAYAISGTPARRRLGPYLEDFAALLMACQTQGGLFRSVHSNKQANTPPFGDGKRSNWTCTKGTEEALLAGALFAIRAQLWRNDRNHPSANVADATMDLWVNGFWNHFWREGAQPVPFDYIGQRPITWGSTGPVFGAFAAPGEAPTLNFDGAEVMAVFGARALELQLFGCSDSTPAIEPEWVLNTVASAAVKDAAGAIDPLGWSRKLSLSKLELDDRSPLLAFLERY